MKTFKHRVLKSCSTVLLILWGCIPFQLFAQVPKLNSYPQAVATIYLDFDGQEVQGTSWNWNGLIVAEPPSIPVTTIREIFERVAEDYRIFNINITTDSNAYNNANANRRIRVIVTPTNSWYQPEAGGVSFVGSFNWGDNTPAFVFTNVLYNQPKYIAEVISHESGHTLGLQHQSSYNSDCTLSKEYCEGEGSGEISWAPIMGLSYYRNVTTWNNGPSTVACHLWQNDLQVIAGVTNNYIGFRDDDHGGSVSASTPLQVTGIRFHSSGMINASGDKDVFRLNVPVSTPVHINIDPMNVGSANAGANVDLKLILLKSQAETLLINNPLLSLSTGLDTTLQAGTYYLQVEGTSNANLPEYGSLGYYTIQGILGSTLPVRKLLLKGKKINDRHELSWEIDTDENIQEIAIESSGNGNTFTKLASAHSGTKSFTIKHPAKAAFYRIRVTTIDNKLASYSNIISIRESADKRWVIQNKIVREALLVEAGSDGMYELLDANGQVTARGSLRSGNNIISILQLSKGLFFLRAHANNQVQTFKLIKL